MEPHCLLPSLTTQSEKHYEKVDPGDKKQRSQKRDQSFGVKVDRCVLFNSYEKALEKYEEFDSN